MANLPTVDTIAKAMTDHHAPSSKARKDSASYHHIAETYLTSYCDEIMRNIVMNNNLFYKNQTRINKTNIRAQNKWRYNRKHYWIDWLNQNFPIVTEVVRGNSCGNVTTLVRLNYTIMELMDVMEEYNKQINVDDQILNTKQLINIGAEYHDVKIDMENLENFMRVGAMTLHDQSKSLEYIKATERNFVSAFNILSLAQDAYPGYGVIRQAIKPKTDPADRTYYAGTSLQNIGKNVRVAALGECRELDLNAGVFSYYAYLLRHTGTYQQLEKVSIVEYARNKDQERARLAKLVASKSENISYEHALKLVKQAMTAISFGAKSGGGSWQNIDGQWQSHALATVIKSKAARQAFVEDRLVVDIIRDIKQLAQYYVPIWVADEPELLKRPEMLTPAGKPSHSAIMSLMYRRMETQVMQDVLVALAYAEVEVLTRVHDGVYVRSISNGKAQDVNYLLSEKYGGAFFQVSLDKPDWRYANPDLHQEDRQRISDHRDRIAQEEHSARNYVSNDLVTMSGYTPAPVHINISMGESVYKAVAQGDLTMDDLDSEALQAYKAYSAENVGRIIERMDRHNTPSP